MAEAAVANLPVDIAKRELATVGGLLGLREQALLIRMWNEAAGPGNCLMLTLAYEHVSEVVTAFGRVGASSEAVAAEAVRRHAPISPAGHQSARIWPISSSLLMALAAGGRFATGPLSEHTRTNIATVRRFLEVPIDISDRPDQCCTIEI